MTKSFCEVFQLHSCLRNLPPRVNRSVFRIGGKPRRSVVNPAKPSGPHRGSVSTCSGVFCSDRFGWSADITETWSAFASGHGNEHVTCLILLLLRRPSWLPLARCFLPRMMSTNTWRTTVSACFYMSLQGRRIGLVQQRDLQ